MKTTFNKFIIIILLFGYSLNGNAAICTLSGTYNASTLQTAINTGCGANDSIYFTGTASWGGSNSLDIGVGRTLFIFGTISLSGSAKLISIKPIFIPTGGSLIVNSGAGTITVAGYSFTGAASYTGPTGLFSGGVILPVELTLFKGKFENNQVILEWTTASEIKNKGFFIERSIDGVKFERIGFVEGNGDSKETIHYQYIDKAITSKIYYYRLRQCDLDENFEYSKIIAVPIQSIDFDVNIYPVPVIDKLNVQSTEYTKYVIYNSHGSEIMKGSVGAVLDVIGVSTLANGNYYIRFTADKMEVKTFSFFKMN